MNWENLNEQVHDHKKICHDECCEKHHHHGHGECNKPWDNEKGCPSLFDRVNVLEHEIEKLREECWESAQHKCKPIKKCDIENTAKIIFQ